MRRLLIGVMTCHARPEHPIPQPERTLVNHLERLPAIRETWADESTRFFFGRGDHDPIQPDEIILDCGDSYFETAFKVQAMCRWALENNYTGLFKADDDTYVRPERLSYDQDFVCRVLPATDINHPVPYPYGGCGYYLGERMLNLAAVDASPTSDPEGETWGRCNTYEDGWIGRVARDAGIEMIDDHRLKHVKPATSEFENYDWRTETPRRDNDMIAVCEFPGDMMRRVHDVWRESCGEIRQFS